MPASSVASSLRSGWLGATLEGLLVFLHLAPFRHAPRVHVLHLQLLLAREPRQVADEGDELPGLVLAVLASVAPARHARHPHAVLDDVEELAVAELLGVGPA